MTPNKKVIIAPSILSADFSNLAKDIRMVESGGAEWLHIDVMDGHFVPNITIGPLVVESVRKHSKLFFDVHLMISRPDVYYKEFIKAGADLITFHSEVSCDKIKLINDIKAMGVKAGISIKPKTPVSDIADILPLVDLVLVMTVEPGFGGQAFMSDMLSKIRELKSNYKCLIEVDGGINAETAAECARAGADVLVSGNYIFKSDNPKEKIKILEGV